MAALAVLARSTEAGESDRPSVNAISDWLHKGGLIYNSEAREFRHDSNKQTGRVDDFDYFLKGKSQYSQKLRLHSLHFPQNTLMLT